MAKKKLPANVRLKAVRRKHKLSQQGLGDLVGASASRVSEWESGRHKPARAHGIALALQTRLMGDEIRVEDW